MPDCLALAVIRAGAGCLVPIAMSDLPSAIAPAAALCWCLVGTGGVDHIGCMHGHWGCHVWLCYERCEEGEDLIHVGEVLTCRSLEVAAEDSHRSGRKPSSRHCLRRH